MIYPVRRCSVVTFVQIGMVFVILCSCHFQILSVAGMLEIKVMVNFETHIVHNIDNGGVDSFLMETEISDNIFKRRYVVLRFTPF